MSSESKTIFVIQGSHLLTDYFAHGDGLVAWGFIEALAARGHTLHVAAPIIDVAGRVPDGVSLYRVASAGLGPVGDAIEYMLRIRALFRSISRRSRIDVAHQLNPVARGLSLALVGCDVPIVLGTFVGDWPVTASRRDRLVGLAKGVIDIAQQSLADAVVLATPHALARFPLASSMDDRTHFVQHGVDTALYHPAALPGDPPHVDGGVLMLGSLQWKKGIRSMVDAFALLAARVPTATLMIIGDGGEEDDMRRWLDELGVGHRARFLGRMSRDDVARWIRAADVLCAPSLGEPYGQNVLEAMATGKPVVTSTAGGHPFVAGPEAGARVDSADPAAIADALEALLVDDERARRIGAQNRETIEARNAWPVVAAELDAVYDAAIARHAALRSANGAAPKRR